MNDIDKAIALLKEKLPAMAAANLKNKSPAEAAIAEAFLPVALDGLLCAVIDGGTQRIQAIKLILECAGVLSSEKGQSPP